MKKLSLIVCALMTLGIAGVKAQHPVNSFFDDLGTARIQTVEYSEAADTIVTTFHRLDDIMWSKVVYRIIDLRFKQNYQLYFPQKVNDPDYKNLFRVILEAIEDGMTVYDMIDEQAFNLKPDYTKPIDGRVLVARMQDADWMPDEDEDDETNELTKLRKQVLHYDTLTNKYEFNKSEIFETISKNQIKFLIQEIVFFDRHTSRLHSTIMAIAPLRSDRIRTTVDEEDSPKDRCEKITSAVFESFTCWIPFLKLRPYLVMQYVVPIANETKRVTFDEFFQKRMYSSYLLGEDNLRGRMITQYTTSEEEVHREQERIEREMMDFEQDLWAY